MPDRSVLTVELGTRCNNRCAFCPQHHLRCRPFTSPDLSTDQVKRRIRDGARQGFSRLAFTGGEPTIRPDLPALIAYGRSHGFAEVALTSNARMLAIPGAARELLEAGLTHFSFSLHSARAAVHDLLSGVSGALEQLTAGVAELRETAAGMDEPLQLHSVTLLLPENVDGLEETLALAAKLGATIHIVQPFIASRANLHVAAHHVLPLERLAQATVHAGRVALRLGTRVKPYNIPYCALESLDGIELQPYKLATHKRQDFRAGRDREFGQAQFYRIDRCEACASPCPGIRLEHYPRDLMAQEILADAEEFRSAWHLVPALDLLDAPHLEHVLRELARRVRREVVPITGGYQWCSPAQFAKAAAAAGVRNVMHLLRTDWDPPRGEEADPGNEHALLTQAEALADQGLASHLFLSMFDLAHFPYPPETVTRHFESVVVTFPRYWRGLADEAALSARVEELGERALKSAENLAQTLPVRLATFDSVRILPRVAMLWQKAFAGRLPAEDWSAALVRHRYASPRYNFILWSHPFWAL